MVKVGFTNGAVVDIDAKRVVDDGERSVGMMMMMMVMMML